MKQLLRALNKKYDSVPEPTRFLTMLALVMPGIVLATMNSATLVAIGWTWLLILLAFRMGYIHKWVK